LILLEKVYNVSEEEANKLLDLSVSDSTKVICGRLLNRSKDWASIAKILKENEDDPETIRRGVLGYMEKVLLNPKNSEMDRIRASEVIEAFGFNLWEGGKPKLIQSFYKAFLKMQELK
jgi:hypothetical protein